MQTRNAFANQRFELTAFFTTLDFHRSLILFPQSSRLREYRLLGKEDEERPRKHESVRFRPAEPQRSWR
jgi:hypothetical protein